MEKQFICKNPTGCTGNYKLTPEEREAPGYCRICSVVLCDTCVIECDNIPAIAQYPLEKRAKLLPKPEGVISGLVCTEHYQEAWL